MEYSQIIGLDLSLTGTGISVLTNLGAKTNVVKTSSKQPMMDRYKQILASVLATADVGTSLYIIEGYSFGSFMKSSSLSNLMELGGIIKYELSLKGAPFYVVPPTVLKKFITGKGNAKKEDMKLALYKKYEFEFETSDEADAFALSILGAGIIKLKTPYTQNQITKPENECIQKITGEGITK